MFFKQGLLAYKRRLVCTPSKPYLKCKQALFEKQVVLVGNTPRFYLSIKRNAPSQKPLIAVVFMQPAVGYFHTHIGVPAGIRTAKEAPRVMRDFIYSHRHILKNLMIQDLLTRTVQCGNIHFKRTAIVMGKRKQLIRRLLLPPV